MNLSGEDLVPERNHVFHLEIPKDWKTPDVGKFWKSIFFPIRSNLTCFSMVSHYPSPRFILYLIILI